jgi:hypothetical protein
MSSDEHHLRVGQPEDQAKTAGSWASTFRFARVIDLIIKVNIADMFDARSGIADATYPC